MSVFRVILVRIFSALGLNTERYGVSFRIQSKCGKMRTNITPNTDTFYAVSHHIQFKGGKMRTRITPNTDTFYAVSLRIQSKCGEMRTIRTNFTQCGIVVLKVFYHCQISPFFSLCMLDAHQRFSSSC